MPTNQLLPLYIFGTLLVTGFTIAVIISVISQKQRQVRNRLARQKMEFEYRQSLLNTRIEVQNTTLNLVAQELHDNIAQALTGCFMQVSALAKYIKQPHEGGPVEEAKATIKDVISGVRLLSHSLASSMIERRELHEAIQAELSRLEKFSNLHCTLRSDTIHELDPEQRLVAFRIVQEVLQNVIKHAQASTVIVSIDNTDTEYRITVEDNGIGFNTTEALPSSSLGLVSISDRIGLLKGQLTIDSKEGTGTKINIVIPINTA